MNTPIDDATAAADKGTLSPAPAPRGYTDGDMSRSVRVACASNNGEMLDGHFGSCARFLIYQVSPAQTRLIDVRSGPRTSGSQDGTPHEDKTADRVDLIRDCHLLYVVAIGGPAAAKVVNAGVHPVKFPSGQHATELLRPIQQVLGGTPPPWLAKAMGNN